MTKTDSIPMKPLDQEGKKTTQLNELLEKEDKFSKKISIGLTVAAHKSLKLSSVCYGKKIPVILSFLISKNIDPNTGEIFGLTEKEILESLED
jgi:hypothetical protein